MKLVNETEQLVQYSISSASSADCGQIPVKGLVDLPFYDNQTNVKVSFYPTQGTSFKIDVAKTVTGEQVEMLMGVG